ncbi:MAG: hypothetical protein IJP48_05080 [Synergistaceae bacterium]|nr:hypothetical protein [Synergistaceae bacterium]
MNLFFKRVSGGVEAGLSIHNKFLRYVELDEMHERIREVTIDLPEGCVVNSSIKNFSLLEQSFVKLRETIRDFHAPVVIGLPSGDVNIKPLPFPDMPIEDIKSVISTNFEEHFTLPANDSVFDAVIVSTPPSSQHKVNNITAIAVAARRSRVDLLLETARKAGMTIKAIEPSSFSLLRSITEDSEGLCIFADPRSIIATWQGHGILFRSADNTNSFNAMRSTIQFVESTYRGVRVSKIILAQVNFQLTSTPEVQVVNIKDMYYSAEGLALRESSDLVLDLRPADYVALEKRRNSLNASRIVLASLTSAFLLLSLGTVIFTFVRMTLIQNAIEINHLLVNELALKRNDLIKDNARLQKIKAQTERNIDFLIDDMPVLEVLNSIEVNAGTGIKIDDTSFARSGQVLTVSINGTASDEKSLISLSEGLKATGMFQDVMMPTTQKNAANESDSSSNVNNVNNVKFSITLTLRSENNDDANKNQS